MWNTVAWKRKKFVVINDFFGGSLVKTFGQLKPLLPEAPALINYFASQKRHEKIKNNFFT